MNKTCLFTDAEAESLRLSSPGCSAYGRLLLGASQIVEMVDTARYRRGQVYGMATLYNNPLSRELIH